MLNALDQLLLPFWCRSALGQSRKHKLLQHCLSRIQMRQLSEHRLLELQRISHIHKLLTNKLTHECRQTDARVA